MPSDAILIGTSIMTVIASGVTSSVVTYRLNRSKERFAFMRQKAEQLYLTINEFGTNFDVIAYSQLCVADGQITWDQMNDMANASLEKGSKHGGAETMKMLIDIYFPEAQLDYQKMDEAREAFMKVKAGHKKLYLREQGVGADIRTHLNSAALGFDSAKKTLLNRVVALSREYANDGAKRSAFWRLGRVAR